MCEREVCVCAGVRERESVSKLRKEKMSVRTTEGSLKNQPVVCSMNDSPVRGQRAPGIATAK